MIILRIACDNLYLFKNFEVDFTYNRQISHPLSVNDKIFSESRIKVRKNLIILGANASGKTTFGKLMCVILNFICGKNIDEDKINILSAIYDKNKSAKFEIEFLIGDTAYYLKTEFKKSALYREELSKQKVYKTYDIAMLRKKLKQSEPVSVYDADKDDVNLGFQSYAFSVAKNSFAEKVKSEVTFWFRFSEYNTYSTDYERNVNFKMLSRILPIIDNSVKNLQLLYADNQPTNSYIINFKNGERLTIPEGDLRLSNKLRLSHGTIEAIDFISMLNFSSGANIFYIDEILAHMNPELEMRLVRTAFMKKKSETQIFFTTHDVQMLTLNVPINSFMFFRRNKEGFNEAVYPSEKINKNDRNLKGYYDNDYFNILPDYSEFDLIFGEDYE